ncbi:MAG: SRPBCC family protein [Actinomycetota bacterium]
MRFEQTIVINAPADKVFAYVSDLTKLPEWGQFGNEVRQTSQGPVGVGSTFDTSGKQFGKHTDHVTVTEYVPGKKFTVEVTGDAGDVRNWFELAEQGTGSTNVTKGQEFTKPAMSARLSKPVIKRLAPKGLMKDLEKIKARIEGTA